MERDEHKLVVETLSKLNDDRKAFRMVGGVLVERTVGDVLPAVSQNFDGVSDFSASFSTQLTEFMLDQRIACKVR